MPQRTIGIRGYVGERIVEEWLRKEYSESRGFGIVTQVRPLDVDPRGGPYLDFGVVRNDALVAVYEVKAQDYVFDGKETRVNKALRYMWDNEGKVLDFVTQDGSTIKGSQNTRGYLILLVPPNERGMKEIGNGSRNKVLLFSEISRDIDFGAIAQKICQGIEADVFKEMDNLRHPTQGKMLRELFLKWRGSA